MSERNAKLKAALREKDQRIAELGAERDDYKDRWEQTGCTRHEAMEAAIKVNKELLAQIAELEAALANNLGYESLPDCIKRDPVRDSFVVRQADEIRRLKKRIATLESGEWERWLLDTSIEQAERAQRAEERLDAVAKWQKRFLKWGTLLTEPAIQEFCKALEQGNE